MLEIEKEIIGRTVSTTEEPDKNMIKFMSSMWNHALLNDAVVWKTPYSQGSLDTILKWFDSIDKRFGFGFGFDEGTVLYYYKWASRYRFANGYNPCFISSIRFYHVDIINEGKKIHINCMNIEYSDGSVIRVPIYETIDYSLQ